MDMQHEQIEHKGRFFIIDNNKTAAEMTYSMAGTARMIIDHTEVADAFKGKKLGQQLVLKAVELARKENYKILPLCPFAKAQFAKHPEWNDVL